MAVRPTSKHLDLEAADSLGDILKSEQEQCLKKFVADKDVFVSGCLLVLVSLFATYFYLR